MKAIASLLYSPDYLPGALVLGHTLRKFHLPDTRLVLLIDRAQFDSVQLLALREIWDVLEDTKTLQSRLVSKLTNDLKRPELACTFTKIQLWTLPYETVLYLDADTLPIVGTRNVTDLLQLSFPVNKIVASPDSGFPDVFNSGVFMLHPNEPDYQNLMSLVLSNHEDISFDGADQGLLNQYFNAEPDWVARHLSAGNAPLSASTVRDSNWIQIPFLYNTTPNAHYEYYPASNHFGYASGTNEGGTNGYDHADGPASGAYIKSVTSPYYHSKSPYGDVSFEHFSRAARSQIRLIHYIGPVKPWKVSSTGIFEKWWSAWFDYSNGKSIRDAIYTQRKAIKSGFMPKITPSDLCNPENYQQFATNYLSSANIWDATTEAPPSETPKADFNNEIISFQNSWDVPEYLSPRRFKSNPPSTNLKLPTNSKQPPTNSKQLTDPKQTSSEISSEGNHTDQIAERVFDNNYDYVPEHMLITKAEAEATPEYRAIFQEESLDEEEESELEAIEQESSATKIPEYPRIFPWEFRDNNVPTRRWD